ncbi:hypothetical protein CXU03_07380 [Akkermansia muciniphila]|nr:hypothetical protein CXU03_07380 [Akkermansia muciniphila]
MNESVPHAPFFPGHGRKQNAFSHSPEKNFPHLPLSRWIFAGHKAGSMPNAPHFQDSILLEAPYGLLIRNLARENRFSTGQTPGSAIIRTIFTRNQIK